MAGTRNPFGRRSNAGSRIHLTRPAGKKTTDAKKRLAKRLGELRLLQMIFAVNSPDLANLGGLRSILPFSVSVFSISAFQLYPNLPFSPATPFSPSQTGSPVYSLR
jgi:hypothetical protein